MVSYMTTLSFAVNRCTDGSAGGVFRLRSLAKTRISYLVSRPFCSSNSPMASSSYILSMVIYPKEQDPTRRPI